MLRPLALQRNTEVFSHINLHRCVNMLDLLGHLKHRSEPPSQRNDINHLLMICSIHTCMLTTYLLVDCNKGFVAVSSLTAVSGTSIKASKSKLNPAGDRLLLMDREAREVACEAKSLLTDSASVLLQWSGTKSKLCSHVVVGSVNFRWRA